MISNKLKSLGAALTLSCLSSGISASVVAHFPMDVVSGKITETVSGAKFDVKGNFPPENMPGAIGQALRFDGYTSYVEGPLGAIIRSGSSEMTVSAWVALPCYPIIEIDKETTIQTPVISTIDETSKTGFGFFLGFNGQWSFRAYVGGWLVTVNASTPLPTYQWNCMTAVIRSDTRQVILYNNGVEVGSNRCAGSLDFPASTLRMGRGTQNIFSGPFLLTSFNGLIDDVTIWNEALSQSAIASWKAENAPDLDIPESRFASDLLRPRFHGMPAAGWTNECHGMYYSDGRYHLFFQKNGDGPYMARLHWGHISSENLYDWREERIALAPSDRYDIKGCWSGCVFSDNAITGGNPNILYTAVDYARATIAQAAPESDLLDKWVKSSRNPIINGRPDGLSDDFRDPYFFRHGDNAYIIVGSSKNGVGTTTLHRYNSSNGLWSNNGDIFFSGKSATIDGTFWEMPNITPMPDGKWLFTATPLGASQGVRTLYWTGDINSEGKFVPDTKSLVARQVELNSRDGFGLLSPTIYNHNGKVIALGIVPDKLPSATNWKLGWAHCYSLPREWSINEDGNLIQKPFESLTGLRTSAMFSKKDFYLNGSLDLSPVNGREAEICATFEVGTAEFGFNIFKSDSAEGKIYYKPSTGQLIADFSKLPRLSNDNGVYDGIYVCSLPERPSAGEKIKINIFIDHSILDIFVDDKWATSIRVFPTEKTNPSIEAFASASTKVVDLSAWILNVKANGSGIDDIIQENDSSYKKLVNVYNLQGALIRSNVAEDVATENLPKGFYIAGDKKILIK